MTLLVFPARTAGAGIIAADLLAGAHGGRQWRAAFRGGGEGFLVVGVVVLDVLHGGLRSRFLNVFGAYLYRHQEAGDFDAHEVEQHLEQLEGFAFVFLLWILLGVAAQVDALAQVVERRQMFAPVGVQALQHDVALERVEGVGADEFDLGLIGRVGLIDDAFQDVAVV